MSTDTAITETNLTAVVNNIMALFNKHGLAHVPRKDAQKFVEILSDIAVDIITRDDEIAKLREQLANMPVLGGYVSKETIRRIAIGWSQSDATILVAPNQTCDLPIYVKPALLEKHAGGRDAAAAEFGNTLAGKK